MIVRLSVSLIIEKKIFKDFHNGIKHTVNETLSDLYQAKIQTKLQN